MVVRHRHWLSCLVVVAALLAAGCAGEKAPATDLATDIDEVAATLIEQPLLHSTSIGVVYRGQAFIRHRGDMEAGKPGPPTDATLYEIGSLSKTLAGTLMANAVLEHKVGLDDDIRMYLQGDYPNLQYKGEPLRVRNLLSHTSGLPNMLPARANTVLADFTDHRTPGQLNAVYARYGQRISSGICTRSRLPACPERNTPIQVRERSWWRTSWKWSTSATTKRCCATSWGTLQA